MMGVRASPAAELVFEDCDVPEENVLGGTPGTGFRTALGALDIGRISLAAGAVGSSQHLLELAIAHSKRRGEVWEPSDVDHARQWVLAGPAGGEPPPARPGFGRPAP